MNDIYKEFNILELESDINFEKAYNDVCFSNMLIFIESQQDDTSIKNKIITAFKAFINKCVETIKDLYYKLKEKINEIIIQRKLNKLTEFSKMVDNAKKQGKTSIECIDIDKIVELLKEESQDYKKEIISFSYKYINGNKTPDRAEKDIRRIETKMDMYSKQLNELLNSSKIYNINDAEKLVLKLTKDKEYIEVLNNYTKEIKDIEEYTINVMKSIEIYRDENGLNDLSGIQSVIAKSILYVRDHAFQIVSTAIKILSLVGAFNKIGFKIEVPNGINPQNKKQMIALANEDPKLALKMAWNPVIKLLPVAVGFGIDGTINKNKKKERIDEITKIYQSPSLKFR